MSRGRGVQAPAPTGVSTPTSSICSHLVSELPLSRSARRALAAILLTTQLGACTVWRVAGPTPAEYLSTHAPGQVRVSRANFPDLLLIEPSIRGDSLHGFPASGGRVSFPLAEVQQITIRKVSWTRSFGVVGSVAGGVALVALLSNCDDPRSAC